MGHRLTILGWHNVEPTWGFPGSSASGWRRAFQRQVHFLRRATNVVPLRSALADLVAGRPLPPRAVALTFDDGYLDNVTVAAPVLAAAGLPATFFLVPGFLDGSARAWWEELGWVTAHASVPFLEWQGQRHSLDTPEARRAALVEVSAAVKVLDQRDRDAAVDELRKALRPQGPPRPREFMDWTEAEQLLRAGHDIQSHTCTHPILAREEQAVQERELQESRRRLAEGFARPIDVLAFPNGSTADYSALTLQVVRQSGYAFAVTTTPHVAERSTGPREMPRLVVDPDVGPLRLAKRWGTAWVRSVSPVDRA